MHLNFFFVFWLALFSLPACSPKSTATTDSIQPLINYEHPITHAPEQYVCYKANEPLVIDGQLIEKDWNLALPTKDFVDIEGSLKPLPKFQTYAKMLWDKNYLYVAAKLTEPHIWAKLTERDAVIFQDDDFEVFIDPDGDGHNYYEFEVNAINTMWDLILLKPYRIDKSPKVLNNWDIKGVQCAVHVAGTVNDPSDEDEYWSVEIAIPWTVLKELAGVPTPPRNGQQWRVNFSRVDWTMDVVDGQYQKRMNPDTQKPISENNWVWSPQGRIAMHHPETWGYVQFSNQFVGKKTMPFRAYPQEQIKWALWQLHFQQVAYFKKHQRYSSDIKELTPVTISLPSYTFQPVLENYTGGYQILAKDVRAGWQWIVNEDGRIWKVLE